MDIGAILAEILKAKGAEEIAAESIRWLKEISVYISNLLKKVNRDDIEDVTDILLMERVELSISRLKEIVKSRLQDQNISKVAFCDVKQLVKKFPNVPEWERLERLGVTHMLVTISLDGKIGSAYFYQDLSGGADKTVYSLINETGEGIVVIKNEE